MRELKEENLIKRKRGRPRTKREEPIENVIEEKQETDNKKYLVFGTYIKPYTGKDDLPDCEYDSKGNVAKAGEPRYFLAGNNQKGFKLIAVYKARTIKRSLVRQLNVHKKPRIGNDPRHAAYNARIRQDKELLKKFRDIGIPGAI